MGGSSSAADDAAEKKKKELNIIECRPVVRDELYAQYINAGKDQEHQNVPTRGLPQAEEQKVDQMPIEHALQADEQVASAEEQPAQTAQQDAPQSGDSGDSDTIVQDAQGGAESEAEQKPQPQVEEFVLGSYVLAYDLETGKMTVEPDPAEVVQKELDATRSGSDNNKQKDEGELTPKEAEAMEALLTEFRKSLEEMMQNVGGALRNARDDAATIKETIKTVQEAYEAAVTDKAAPGDNQAQVGERATNDGGKNDRQHQPGTGQGARKADPLSRLTRTGAHNHREIAEKYLKGQLGLSAGNKKLQQRIQEEAAAAHLHKQREARQQHKIGTAQFRNMKRAFEQKWDDDEADNASPEGKSEGLDKAKNVAPVGRVGADAGAPAERHDEL